MTKSKHRGSFQIVQREPEKVWAVNCGDHFMRIGPTYEAVEDIWREHVYAETGKVGAPAGDTTIPRWKP